MFKTTADDLPTRLRGRTRIAVTLALAILGLATFGWVTEPARAEDPLLPPIGTCANDINASTSWSATDPQRMAVDCLINAVRRKAGAHPLRYCAMSGTVCSLDGVHWALFAQAQIWATGLNIAAQYKSQDVMACAPAADPHNACDRAPSYWPARNVYPWPVAEILAAGWPTMNPRQAVDWWLHSPEHRRIMLDDRYVTLGVGVTPGVSQGLMIPKAVSGHVWAAQLGVG